MCSVPDLIPHTNAEAARGKGAGYECQGHVKQQYQLRAPGKPPQAEPCVPEARWLH